MKYTYTKDWPIGYGTELIRKGVRYDVAAVNTELKEWKVNARLISSIPKMYELLKNIEKTSGIYSVPFVIEIREMLDFIENGIKEERK